MPKRMTTGWIEHVITGRQYAYLRSCVLCIIPIDGENWRWSVRLADRDVADGRTRTAAAARQQAETAAMRISFGPLQLVALVEDPADG